MLTSILSFKQRPAAPSRNWTDQEKAEFYRVIDVLGRSGIQLDLETGLTDEDEPWAVFCAPDSGDPVVHIARLDGRYVLAATTMAAPIRGPDLRMLVRRALDDVPAAILPKPEDRQGGAGFTLHPAALLLVLVATSWFHAANAAEPGSEALALLPQDGQAGPEAQHLEVMPAADAAPSGLDSLRTGQGRAASSQAADAQAELALQRFHQAVTIAVALMAAQGAVLDDLAPVSVAVELAPGAAGAAEAAGSRHVSPTQDGAPLLPAETPHHKARVAMAAAALEAFDEQEAVPQDGLGGVAEGKAVQALLVAGPSGPPAPAAATSPAPTAQAHGQGDVGHAPAWHQQDMIIPLVDEGGLVPVWSGLAKAFAGWSAAPAAPASASITSATVATQPIPGAAAAPAVSVPSAAFTAWSMVAQDKAVQPLDKLPTEVAQKILALLFPTDMAGEIALAKFVASAAEPHAGAASSSTTAAMATGGATTPSAAVAPEAGHASLATAPPALPAQAAAQEPALPAGTVSLSSSGVGAAQTQQVSLAEGLAQLQAFTATTTNYTSVATDKSLVLIEQAVLDNMQRPHVIHSLHMADGSDITWVQLVGVAETPWHV